MMTLQPCSSSSSWQWIYIRVSVHDPLPRSGIRDSRTSRQKNGKTRHTFVKIAKITAKSRQQKFSLYTTQRHRVGRFGIMHGSGWVGSNCVGLCGSHRMLR